MIPTIKHETLQRIMGIAYERKLASFIWGTFGIGKSDGVRKFGQDYASANNLIYNEDVDKISDEKNFSVLVIALHQFDPAEFKGLPVANREEHITEYFTTNMLPTRGKGIIFFDELNLAPALVQANAYQLILDRRLGEYILPEGWVAMAAGNMLEDRAHTQEMAMPLKNRFAHWKLAPPTAKDWTDQYAIPHKLDQRIINFVMGREDLIHKYNPDTSEEVIACPTPRTWAFASRAIEEVEDEDTIEILVGGLVGLAVAQEFVAWTRLAKKVDISKIFKTKKIEVPDEISEIYALISAITAFYSKNKDSKEKSGEYAETLLDLARQFKAEHNVLLLHLAKNSDEDFFKKLRAQCPAKLKGIAEDFVKFLI